MENDGIQNFTLRTYSFAGMVRPADTCSGTMKSNSSPARHKRLTRPDTISVESIVARIRNSRLFADATAAKPTSTTAAVNNTPPRVTL